MILEEKEEAVVETVILEDSENVENLQVEIEEELAVVEMVILEDSENVENLLTEETEEKVQGLTDQELLFKEDAQEEKTKYPVNIKLKKVPRHFF
jgi:hypothetical protein